MKININVIQHMNAAVILGMCIFYPLFYVSTVHIKTGILIWAVSLPFLYFPDLMVIPGTSKKEMEGTKKLFIFLSWFFVLFYWNWVIKSTVFTIVIAVFFIVLVGYCLYFIMKYKKEESVGQ
jgi:hypothetical protein